MKRSITTLFFLFFTLFTSFAQGFICGTANEEPNANFDFNEYADFIKMYKQEATSRTNQTVDTILVKLFITGPEISNRCNIFGILESIVEVNKEVERGGFMFHINKEDITYILDSKFIFYDDDEEREALRKTYNDKNALDMYVFSQVSINNGYSLSGFSTGSLRDGGFVVLKKSSLSTALIAHELGHSLGLRHTHGKFNSISDNTCLNRSYSSTEIPIEVFCQGAVKYDNQPNLDEDYDGIPDCLQTGDDVCDTNAEPVLNQGRMLDECTYIGTATDYFGDVFNPDIGNFMSYAAPSCRYFFTNEQIGRMRYFLDEYLECNCRKQTGSQATVISPKETGKGTLREAITCINYCERLSEIVFDLPEKDSVLYIKSLPTIFGSASINGLTKFDTRIVIDGGDKYSGIRMIGQSFQVQNLNTRSCFLSGLYVEASEQLLIDSCSFSKNGLAGLSVIASELLIDNSSFSKNELGGLSVIESGQLLIDHSSFTENGLGGLSVIASRQLLVDNSSFTENSSVGLFVEVSELLVDNSSFIRNERDGLLVLNNNNSVIRNVSSIENGKTGIFTFASDSIFVYGSRIEKNQNGLITIDAQRVTIGGLNEQQNYFIENSESGISIEGTTQNAKISQNYWACNEVGISMEEGVNKEIAPPVINPIIDRFSVSGTAGAGEIIALYKASTCNTTCEGEFFITEVVSNGAWRYLLDEPLEDGDKITAISTKDNNSSTFADCVQLDCAANSAACMTTASINIKEPQSSFEVYPNPVAETLIIDKTTAKLRSLVKK